MEAGRIEPEKITHPIQLMAAWFVMLIMIDSALLLAASQIEEPIWIRGFLSIAAIGLAVLVMILVFLMLTKFRPHLQESKEYSEWLRDERKPIGKSKRLRSVENTQRISEITIKTLNGKSEKNRKEQDIREEFEVMKEIITQPIQVNNLEDSTEVVNALKRQGFQASIYRTPSALRGIYNKEIEEHESIWLGSEVKVRVALLAIKTVLKYWNHLKYIDLSEDHSEGPDYTHYEIFFGGATQSAKEWNLKEWKQEELLAIDNSISKEKLHEMIRSRY